MKRLFLLGSVATAAAGVGYYESRDVHSPIYPRVILPVMHRWMDAEQAHNFSVMAASLGLTPKLKHSLIPNESQNDRNMLHVSVLDMQFENPIGLAAGYDKNAQCMSALSEMGFGFMEVGSICPLPQDGNPKPRIFRAKTITTEGANNELAFDTIVNRCGFNSHGMDIAEERLKQYVSHKKNEKQTNVVFPVGVNIGKNKISDADSVDDYVTGLNRLSPYADFMVVNVSSPNTPGLRSLQNRDPMMKLLSEIQKFKVSNANKKKVLIKIAPDLTMDQKKDIAQLALEYGIDGIIVSNTTIDRPNKSQFTSETARVMDETGGLSGKPLFNKSTNVLRDMYRLTGGKVVLIGVGGVMNGQDALEKIEAGASLVQIYTAFTAKGPSVVDQISYELVQLLKQKGYKNVSEAVGKGSSASQYPTK